MAASHTFDPIAPKSSASSAAVWLNGRRALVATMSGDGRLSTCEFERGWLPESAYLAQLVRVIGDRERVVILGPTSVRLELERDYTAMFRRPERLLDVEPAGPVSREELIARLRTFAA
jgi:hypothetical protein